MPLLLGFQDSTMSMVHGPVSATLAYIESQTQYTSRVQVESRASLGYTSQCSHHESLDSLPHAQVSATPYTSKFKSKPKSDPYSAHSLLTSLSRLPSLRSEDKLRRSLRLKLKQLDVFSIRI
ncbi:hypothetical protein CMV_019712 [Castanea mollissima]|uniref:Uncharacterized protein n=1 Tax=Castanea mollissima TaxID=60419 RepID=A0A8J4R0I0_9ROSI|nr:hypothetical protein CMV_019712 [Castanea mollissima]